MNSEAGTPKSEAGYIVDVKRDPAVIHIVDEFGLRLQEKKNQHQEVLVFCLMWSVLDSNQRPPPCQGGALNQLS